MAESAFGVEHGEFSKARAKKRGNYQLPNNQVRQTLGGAAKKVTGARVSLTDVGNATGRGVGALGTALKAKPGLTGTAVVGGAGYSLHRLNSKKKAPKGM